MLAVVIAIAYVLICGIIIGFLLPYLKWKKDDNGRWSSDQCEVVAVLSGVFWPLAFVIWGCMALGKRAAYSHIKRWTANNK